eukprot:CAMPEP_0173088024 /NCGR_PEP_ID=MMETSP1102-20130122/24515_1 /TAXON_ID=49646 /ORGANISM="Geminigera sp., Strain Caron Lab Isolate" /LENGTH=125 /DNA_ID=CAMNT_0013970503 /DNA_START=8 /DNA_END=386 /DNA_ORIENTATION=-
MPRHVHPDMMHMQGFDPADFQGKDMCAGGIQGYRNDSEAVAHVLEPTVRCALQPDCIAPASADQGNHRFDQAVSRFGWRMAIIDVILLKDADTNDVPDGFGAVYPVLFSRRCESPLSYHPRTRGL